MKKSCKRSKTHLEKSASLDSKATSLAEDYSLAMAEAWDTMDLTVPWDWRKAHMREIEERTSKKSKEKQP